MTTNRILNISSPSSASSASSSSPISKMGVRFSSNTLESNCLPAHSEPSASFPSDEDELERRFNEVLIQMDLPPEHVKLLKSFDGKKKWSVICDQEKVTVREPPSTYLTKLKSYLQSSASKTSKKLRGTTSEQSSTQVLRDLEISLRTNHIEWVRHFLDETNGGLDILIEYLSERLLLMKYTSEDETLKKHRSFSSSTLDFDGPRVSKLLRQSTKLKMADPTDDIHVCIMCLRAIMNNKFGFNMVIQHEKAINSIALSLIHKKLRTKALVLELLAAICLVKGGHTIILKAFDNFKNEMEEGYRFETLMTYFTHPESFQIEFMVAVMQFINIVVHSVEELNFRVALQWEFTALHLDTYLEKLSHHESDELAVQISAYIDNAFDVGSLVEEADAKADAIERLTEQEEELGRSNELRLELECSLMAKQVEWENELELLRIENQELKEKSNQVENEYSTLRKKLKNKDEDSQRRLSLMELKIKELEDEKKKLLSNGISIPTSEVLPPAPPLPPSNVGITPPPPPPPPFMGAPSLSVPPPPPPLSGVPSNNMTIRRAITPSCRLPTLHWISLKPSSTKNTIWYLMDDEKLMKDLDFGIFENEFKLHSSSSKPKSGSDVDGHRSNFQFDSVKKSLTSLLENTRLKSIAICKRKLPNLLIGDIIKAINALDIQTLSLEAIESLQRMTPLDEEIKAYREFSSAKKDVNELTEEDRLMLQFSVVERFSTKLQIMAFMTTFSEDVQSLKPQINAIVLASKSLKNSKKFKRILELILAFGNYMNSAKKGPCYGFKLQSLDSITLTKSSDKKRHLVHFIEDLVRSKYPDLMNFDSDIKMTEKASQYLLENILSDLKKLEKGYEITNKELSNKLANPSAKDRLRSNQNQILSSFVTSANEVLSKLKVESNAMESAYRDCVEYFGEDPKTLDANAFFGIIVRFIAIWKGAELDNEKRRKLEKLTELSSASKANSLENSKNLQNDLINELKYKNSPSSTSSISTKKTHIRPDELEDGTLEDLILNMKSEPYRPHNESSRKSFRSRNRGSIYVTDVEAV